MQSRQEINQVFSSFVAMLEKDDFSKANKVFDQSAELYTTHLGDAKGIVEISDLWKWRGKEVTVNRFSKFNHIIRSDDNSAVESVYLAVQSGYDADNYYHHFNYGYHFINVYKYENSQWKIRTMRCQLDIFEGNTMIVDGWWKTMNSKLYSGYQVPSIVSYFDSPWKIIPKEQNYSDEEAICEVIFKYAWGNDHLDSAILAESMSSQYHMEYSNKGIVDNVRSMIEMALQVRFKEYTMQHIYRIKDINIKGDKADVIFYRHEPHRLGSQVLDIDNRNGMFYSACYSISLIKENDGWKWLGGFYKAGMFYEETVMPDESEVFYF